MASEVDTAARPSVPPGPLDALVGFARALPPARSAGRGGTPPLAEAARRRSTTGAAGGVQP